MMYEIGKPTLYVGCGLTHAPAEFRDEVETTKTELAAEWEIMRFLGLKAGSAGDVYDQDISENVRGCDAFLAIADNPATGLGWELGVADEREIPTLIVARIGSSVSRLLLGAAERRKHINYHEYGDSSQIPTLVREHLRPMLD